MDISSSLNRIWKFWKERTRWQKIIVYAVLSILLAKLLFFCVLRIIPFKELEDFKSRSVSTAFYDCNDKLLYVRPVDGGIKREYSLLKEIPSGIQRAFLLSEDKRFYLHHGVDYLSIVRAAFQNVFSGRTVSGASTVTMQLARMIHGNEGRGFTQKINDVFDAYRIEAHLSKKQILELYLNNIPFSNNAEGVTSAAHLFYGKNLNELNEMEWFSLAVIPRRPVYYNPIKNPDNNVAASYKLYKKAHVFEDFNYEDFSGTISDCKENYWPFYMPHFIQNISPLVSKDVRRYNLSLDLDVQKFLEFEINQSLKSAEGSRINNASAIVLDNKNGKILAWVGSQDFYDSNGGQIDGVRILNQMGSSMKPFLYAECIEKGVIIPSQILPDVPMEFGTEKIYIPLNFNNRFNGPITIRTSLASSLNVPAVYILDKLGTNHYLDCLFNLGFDSLRENGIYADLGLALGAGEVSLEELTKAFSVFANDGVLKEFTYEKGRGEANDIRRIYSSDTARVICDILSDKKARVLGFGYTQSYETSYPSIFKTGTANQYQNIVALGSTDKYTIGVWMGNFSGNTVMGKTGSSLPAHVARNTLDFMAVNNEVEYEDFEKPEGYVKVPMCSLSGMAAGENCKSVVEEYVRVSDVEKYKNNVCSWHRKNEDGKVYTVYPYIYEKWYSESLSDSYVDYAGENLHIVSPADGSFFYYDESGRLNQKIQVEVSGGYYELNIGSQVLKVIYDGVESEMELFRPFTFLLPVERGRHSLTVQLNGEKDSITYYVE